MRPIALARAALLAPAITLAIAGAAHAGAVELAVGNDGSGEVLFGSGSSTADVLTLAGTANADEVIITPGAATTLTLAAGDIDVAGRCTLSPAGVATCDLSGLGATDGTTILSPELGFWMGSGDDTVKASPALSTDQVLGLTLAGEGGNDDLQGGAGPDVIAGDDPTDLTVVGHDRLAGLGGADYYDGGPGNDVLITTSTASGGSVLPDSDRGNPTSACGDGTDMLLSNGVAFDPFAADPTCEVQPESSVVSTRSVNIYETPNNGRFTFEVGQTLALKASPITVGTTAPNDVSATWQRCTSAAATSCVPLGTAPTQLITADMIDAYIAADYTYRWVIPANPWGTWPGGSRRTVGKQVGRESGPLDFTDGPTAAQVRGTLLKVLLPTGTLHLGKLATTTWRGEGSGFATTTTASLSVAPKALGLKGKKPIVIATGSNTASQNVRYTLRLNAKGKKLAKRLAAKKTVKGTVTVSVSVGTPAATGTATGAVTIAK